MKKCKVFLAQYSLIVLRIAVKSQPTILGVSVSLYKK